MKRIPRPSRTAGRRMLAAAGDALHCRGGMAATEFAMILPVLMVLFFGVYEGSEILTASRRVAVSTNTLADMVAQSEQLTESDVSSLMDGVLMILEPADTSALDLTIVSVIDNNGTPEVAWSRDRNGGAPYASGDPYDLPDETVLVSGASLIIAETTYPYSLAVTAHIFKLPFTFSRTAIRWPRLVNRLPLCDDNNANCVS